MLEGKKKGERRKMEEKREGGRTESMEGGTEKRERNGSKRWEIVKGEKGRKEMETKMSGREGRSERREEINKKSTH